MDNYTYTLSSKKNPSHTAKSVETVEPQKLKEMYQHIKMNRKRLEEEALMIQRKKNIIKHTEDKLKSKSIRESYSEKRRKQIKEITRDMKESLESKKLSQRVESETKKHELSMNKENLKKQIEVKRINHLTSIKVKVNEFRREKEKLLEESKCSLNKELLNKSVSIENQRKRYKEMINKKSSSSFKSQLKLVEYLQDRIKFEQSLTSKYSEMVGSGEDDLKSSFIETFPTDKQQNLKSISQTASKVHNTNKSCESALTFDQERKKSNGKLANSQNSSIKKVYKPSNSSKQNQIYKDFINKRNSLKSNGADKKD